MVDLADEIEDVQGELGEVEEQIREALPEFFDMSVEVKNVSVTPENGTASANVEPASDAGAEISEEFGGATVTFPRNSQFRFQFNINE